jgi:hypothetical protein
MSNDSDLSFTDEEVLTIFIYGMMNKYQTIKSIHRYTERHLKDFFPKLPSYVAFNQRINRFHSVFPAIIEQIQLFTSCIFFNVLSFNGFYAYYYGSTKQTFQSESSP